MAVDLAVHSLVILDTALLVEGQLVCPSEPVVDPAAVALL